MDFVTFLNGMTMEITMSAKWTFFPWIEILVVQRRLSIVLEILSVRVAKARPLAVYTPPELV